MMALAVVVGASIVLVISTLLLFAGVRATLDPRLVRTLSLVVLSSPFVVQVLYLLAQLHPSQRATVPIGAWRVDAWIYSLVLLLLVSMSDLERLVSPQSDDMSRSFTATLIVFGTLIVRSLQLRWGQRTVAPAT